MKRVLWSLLLVLGLMAPARAQSVAITTTTCPGAGCSTENVGGSGTVGLQITGTFSGTVSFKVGNDEANLSQALTCFPVGSTTGVTSTTATGIWSCPVTGFKYARFVFTSWVSGSANLFVTRAQARSNAEPTTVPGAPGGSANQVQFNDAGTLNGDAGMTYNKTTDTLTVVGNFIGAGAVITPTGLAGGGIGVQRVGAGAGNASYWGVSTQIASGLDSSFFGNSSSAYTTGGGLGWLGNSQSFFYYPSSLKFGTGVGTVSVLTLDSSLNATFGGIVSEQKTALGTTSTDGVVVENTTAATSGVTVQISPRVRLRGTAWNTSISQTVDFFTENLPASAATPTGTYKIGYSLAGGAATYPFTLSSAGAGTFLAGMSAGATSTVSSGDFNVTTGSVTAGSSLRAGSGGFIFWNSRSILTSGSDGTMSLTNQAATAGILADVTTDATIKLRNRANSADATLTAGAITASGTVTFGSTNVTNAATGVAAGYKIARGTTALDGANPTTVATGLTSVVSCTATLIRNTAVSSGAAMITHDAPSGANVDFYAWLQTGAASTATTNFDWICIGT